MFQSCCDPHWMYVPTPACIPPPLPPAALNGPIRGDTSGNQAMPGIVGEFIQRSVTGSITVSTNSFLVTTITPMTLGPGDWDVDAKLDISVLFTGAQFLLNPSVPGMSGNMLASGFMPGVVHQITTQSIVSLRNQFISASAATILQFDITTSNYTSGSVTGPYTFTINARRVR